MFAKNLLISFLKKSTSVGLFESGKEKLQNVANFKEYEKKSVEILPVGSSHSKKVNCGYFGSTEFS